MDRFLADAESILNTAMSALASGHQPAEMVILTGVRGQVQLLAECDWPLPSIRAERGASSAYRITCRQSTVIVDGDRPGQTCRLERSIASPLPCWMKTAPHQPQLLLS
jgi:hypothetical protein